MQTPGSSFPPLRAATVSGDLYISCACLRIHYVPICLYLSTNVLKCPIPAFFTTRQGGVA